MNLQLVVGVVVDADGDCVSAFPLSHDDDVAAFSLKNGGEIA